jgi:hypothetical protein
MKSREEGRNIDAPNLSASAPLRETLPVPSAVRLENNLAQRRQAAEEHNHFLLSVYA